jgi:peptidoglycan DL-endopeptidase CwlO
VTERVTGRHRAPDRASTPITTLTSTLSTAVSGRAAGMSRGGLVLAMSSGLVAGMGMPASAAVTTPPAPTTSGASQQTLPASFVSGEAVAAPADADVTFERDAFTATKKPQAAASPQTRESTRTSRTATRSTSGSTSGSSTGSSSGSSTKSTSGSTSGSSTGRSTSGSVRGSSVIAVASRYVGVPYRSGGTTPRGFDCSGYTQYVYAQAGVRIPRIAESQRQAATAVSRSQARPGDLVFFLSGGNAYHVGIYAGGNMMYDAGRTGSTVSKRAIWSSNVTFGRF